MCVTAMQSVWALGILVLENKAHNTGAECFEMMGDHAVL